MKKSTLLKLAFVLMAMFSFTGTFAQVVDGTYVQYDPLAAAPANVDYLTLRTGGTTMGFYALPDPVYHPNYNALGGWALTADFVWDWAVTTGTATVAYPVATKPANYVQITFPSTGNYVVNVKEHAPAAFGGCSDATGKDINLTVIATPTGTMSINPGGSWNAIAANQSYQICSGQLAQTVTVAFNEAVPNTLGAYSFALAYKVETIDGTDAVIDTKTSWTIVQDFTSASKLKTGNIGTATAGYNPTLFTTATPAFTYTFATDALNILKKGATTTDARTKYTYRVVRTGTLAAGVAAATNDFRSAISEKSDFLATAAYYTFTNNEVSFIVNPSPVTGPIYHISNTYAY